MSVSLNQAVLHMLTPVIGTFSPQRCRFQRLSVSDGIPAVAAPAGNTHENGGRGPHTGGAMCNSSLRLTRLRRDLSWYASDWAALIFQDQHEVGASFSQR